MAITDDLRKTLTDPTPLYAVAGTADLAAAKLREVPELIEKLRAEAPERLAAVREQVDARLDQERVRKQAKEAQAKISSAVSSFEIDGKKVREVRDTAQDFVLQQVGRAAEYAVKARETYDELAVRGRDVVRTWRGEAADGIEEVAAAVEGGSTVSTGSDGSTVKASAPKKPAARKTTAAKKPAPAAGDGDLAR
ncbi:hypothetical protein ACFW9F_00260 [Streptomyces sp. NPDC059506]|uniref:Heparin binding hemagglutinin HbhA n=1 Tax=Streptomyces thermolineatus TaxID=44033 RepID=A0ABP5Z657_9ACTN|nr:MULTISPECIES: hypothetical protein [unclassified Streptomyces]MCZ2526703.1 hypothetical protein [Streptomyces sp. HB2AG]PLW73807.1 hypothetical protein C0036_05270 [Streptomyces sp. DJ]QMV22228.1 hypothetical protein GQS52_10975 [Streptomyces sp. SCUT-3]